MPNFDGLLATLAAPTASVLLSILSGILTAFAIATITYVIGRLRRRRETHQLQEIFARHEKQLLEAFTIPERNVSKHQVRYVMHRHFLRNTKLIVSVQMRHLTYEQRFDILELIDNRQHMMTELIDTANKVPLTNFYPQFFDSVEALDWLGFEAANAGEWK